MKNHYKILLLLFMLGAIGLLFYSTWYQWKGHQETAYERLKPHQPIAEFKPENKVRTLAISPKDTNIIVSAGEGNDIKVWHRDNPEKPIKVLTNHPIDENDSSISINSVFFDSTGQLLISKSFWMVAFWDVSTWELISSYRIPSSVKAVSPSENLLATSSANIDIWNFSKPRDLMLIYTLRDTSDGPLFFSTKFSYDGRWIAQGVTILDSNSKKKEKKVQIWDLNTKQIYKTLTREIALDNTSNSEEKQSVMVGSDRGIKHSNLTVDKDDIRTISFSPDNKFFVIGNTLGFTIWSLPHWRIYHQVDNIYVIDLAFSPNGKIFAIASLGGIMIWSIDEMKPNTILKGNKRYTLYDKITFSSDGKLLVGSGYNDMIGVWDMETIE